MKSIVSEKIKSEQVDTFPAIGVYRNDRNDKKVIVLFTSPEVGTVLYSDWDHQPVGLNMNNWAPFCFTMFQGCVTLSNE